MSVYYNENDSFAAEWLRMLIKEGQIPHGIVDERSIEEVQAKEVEGFCQCHFFAGIGVWAYALDQAGWGQRRVWTGSCPCQPFSAAGSRHGVSDSRHLWPEWARLIRECRPDTILGEQVASPGGRAWLDLVSDDLERAGYAIGAVNTCACGFGAPHVRQRIYFCAMGNPGQKRQLQAARRHRGTYRKSGSSRPLADGSGARLEGASGPSVCEGVRGPSVDSGVGARRAYGTPEGIGFWRDCQWLPFRDGNWRPIEPQSFPLVNGSPNYVGQLRGYGNAICAPQATAFVEAVMGA